MKSLRFLFLTFALLLTAGAHMALAAETCPCCEDCGVDCCEGNCTPAECMCDCC